ncbi:MAG: 1-phosphofructokinase family hexose kinase [Planctomycetota bacterium]|nr:MAG: 1-phosphofructokinase family hexose kinase [Planctomycetota bacterium]
MNHKPVAVQEWTRQNVIVTEEATNEQYRFCLPGPELSGDEIERCLEALKSAKRVRFAVFSGSLPPGLEPDFYARAARAMGPEARVIVDAANTVLREAVASGVYGIKPNVEELGQLVDHELDGEHVADAGRQLLDETELEIVLVSCGSDGAVLVTRDESHELRAPTVSPRSRVGAGDSMVGAFVWRLNAGESPLMAARYGVAAGAAAVMTPGTELCNRDDVERLFERVA